MGRLEIAGLALAFVLVVAGVAFIFWPAALITAGVGVGATFWPRGSA